MKTKKRLIYFIALLVLITAGVLNFMNQNKNEKILKVAFPSKLKSTDYEPTRISFDYEYIFLENIFSPLVEIAKDGSLTSGVAEKTEWIDDELKLTIRKNLKTSSGKAITTEDVLFSLKRLLILSGNTHGNFKDIVCPTTDIKLVLEECSGLRADREAVYINAKGKKTFLLPMLGAIDFAIIPKASVDEKSLKIINTKETSGPYYVESDDGNGNITLKANPYHFFFSQDIAEKIILVPTNSQDKTHSLKLFQQGLIDHITTIDTARSEELIRFAKGNSDADLHVTAKIRNLILVFTEIGQKKFSSSERIAVGEKARIAFSEIYKGVEGFEQHFEFFPNLSFGGLTDQQRENLEKTRTQKNLLSDKSIQIGLIKRGPLEEWSRPIKKHLPQAECYIETNMPDFKKDMTTDQMPDAIIVSTDTGFTEDISLLSYSLNAGLLGLSKLERAKWLADYMSVDNKEIRIKKVKDLHYNALSKGDTIPLIASPYTAIVRKPWKIELSELFANNQLWRIKHN